jgi:hypothetical protein
MAKSKSTFTGSWHIVSMSGLLPPGHATFMRIETVQARRTKSGRRQRQQPSPSRHECRRAIN